MNGDKIISERDVVTTTKNGLMTPEMNKKLTNIKADSSNFGVGEGNILGGYAVKVKSYNSTTFTFTLDSGGSDSETATKMSKFIAGATVYVSDLSDDISDSSSEIWGEYKSGTIQTVNAANFTVKLVSDIGLSTSADFDRMYIYTKDNKRKDAAFSSGDRNFVTGLAASADGIINTVTGTGSKASGAFNLVSGNFSEAVGVNNTVLGDRNIVSGGNNKVEADMAFVTGNGNEVSKTGQGAVILGSGNNDVTGVDPKILGDGNKVSGNRVNVVGFHNNVSGNESTVIGNALKVESKKGILIGNRGELPNTHENSGAIGFAGGDSNEGTKVVSFIHRTHKTDTMDSDSEEICYSTEYMGRLVPIELEVSDSNVSLDHDLYSKWRLTGAGSIVVTLANWKDGDVGELVIDTRTQTISIPASWIIPDSLWDKITDNPDVYCIEIKQIGSKIYAYDSVIFSDGNTANIFNGGLRRVFQSTNVTAQDGSWYLCDSNITVTLPASSSEGDTVKVSTIKTANDVSIVPSGTDTIESQTGFNIDATNSSVELVYDGTMWVVAEVVVN